MTQGCGDAVKGSSALVCAAPDKAHNRDRSDRQVFLTPSDTTGKTR